ncbi:MAG: EAL domain-containing protein [Clostridiales bacterium]|nr:EAL domain-containing protein [Clostridiales bacterium]
MAEKRKLIGICLSQAHTFLKTDLVSELDRAARAKGLGIVVFNSSLDYYWFQRGNNVTGCIYDMIRYDRLCALIMLHENLYDFPLLERMARCAKEEGIPAFYLGGVRDDCVSVVDDYAEPYKQILRHVIMDHHVRDTFYIAGLPDEDNSKLRLRCYREVLEEAGLPWKEENVAYGNYLDPVAAEIVRGLISGRSRLPGAILCANDSMAASVCDELKAHGIRVPEDVIVTGFDGTPTAYLVHPQLTTCNSNPGELADLVLKLIGDYQAGRELEAVYRHPYRAVLSESCGCPGVTHPRFSALHSFRQAEALFNHENVLYYTVEELLELTDIHEILEKLSALLLPDSVLYMNRSLLEDDPDAEYTVSSLEEEFLAVPYRAPGQPLVFRRVYRKDMPIPNEEADGATILNIVHSDRLVGGYYAVHSSDLSADFQMIKRLSDVLNLIFSIQIGRCRQNQLLAHLENNLYLDSTAGLNNLKGLTRRFEALSADPENHRRAMAFSIYAISRFSYIYEHYGMAETEEIVRAVAEALRGANPEAHTIARVSEDQFAVLNLDADPEALSAAVSRSSAALQREINAWNVGHEKPYFLEVSFGSTTVEPGWENASLENLVRMAMGELYLNRLRDGNRLDIRREQGTAGMYNSFSLLIDKNLFQYYFQPIVDARTGIICAYEALMRTDKLINMSPLDILATAREYNHLYEVEHITFFGIMDHYVRNYADFHGCKLFINTIPGYFLNDADCRLVKERFGSWLDCFVFELTEENATSDEELSRIKQLSHPGGHVQIAIDDYGTGHSNIVNLLRYAPNIIKIDRGLISGIYRDSNRQMFVRNTINFAHQNGIKALAEGVETPEELRTVIEYGVDLIQGFYTGRPAPEPLPALNDTVRNEILKANLQAARYNSSTVVHTLQDGDVADVVELALQKVTVLQVNSGTYTLSGNKSQNVDMVLRVSDNARAEITLDNVSIRGAVETTIQLGNNSDVTLILKGMNTLTKEGILVPATASLTIRGDGNLLVLNNRNYSVGIGANFNDPYGTITLDCAGSVSVRSSGDRVVCLGGGRSAGSGIHLLRGNCNLNASGINVIGLGSASGDAVADVADASLTVHGEGNEVVLIGTVSGHAFIRSAGRVEVSSGCERITGIGTLNGTADVSFEGGSLQASVNCDSGAAVGTYGGTADVCFRNTRVRVHGEGNRVVGFGSLLGSCVTRVESGEIHGDLLAGERLLLGNPDSRFIVTGGNIQLYNDGEQSPVGPDGEPLFFLNPRNDHFEQTFSRGGETWTYRASRNAEGFLGVWIPSQPSAQ